MMRSVTMALSMLVASVGAAAAADMPVKAPLAPPKIEYGNLYFGVDWTSHRSLAGYMGVLYAPDGMHQSGLRLSAFGLLGRYRYHGGDAEEFRGKFASVDAMVGWSHVFEAGAATLAIGANHQDQRVRPSDPGNPVQGSKTGFKVQGDVWVNPTQHTLVYLLGSYSTAFDTYYGIGRLGYDFIGSGVFFGPEVGGQGNDRTDQLRVGAHLSGMTLGSAKLGVSGGWMRERGDGSGWYATGNIDFTF